MRSVIRQRIEQIRRGEVPEGYKKSPFGILPVDWKIKKLSDVLTKQTRKNKDNSVHNVLTNSATQGIISQTDYFDKKIANDENTDGYYLVQPGDFVYNPRISNNAPCGPFNRYNGNQNGIMSPLYTVYRFEDKFLVYSDYLSHYFLSSKWHAYMNGIANYGARSDRMNILSEDMDNMPLPYPSSYEAQRIVEILSTQDKVIELYEKKIKQLQLLKKICLKKMFPRQGKNVPEVRFSGFTAPWEQRKIGEFTSVLSASRVHKYEWQTEGVPFYRSSDVVSAFKRNDNEKAFISVSLYEELIKSSSKLEKDDILITGGGNIGIPYIVPNNEALYTKDADLIWIKKSNYHESKFLYTYFLSLVFREYISSISHVGTIAHYTIEQVKNTPVLMPNLQEQNTIGNYFSRFDDLITLHQRRLDTEKRKKKALMQLLLTGIVKVEK